MPTRLVSRSLGHALCFGGLSIVLSGCRATQFFLFGGDGGPETAHCTLAGPQTLESCRLESRIWACEYYSYSAKPVKNCVGFDCIKALCTPGSVIASSDPWPGLQIESPQPPELAWVLSAPRLETVPATERAALLAIFHALSGPTWVNKGGWGGAGGTECAWQGVLCNPAGTAIVGLELNELLNGTLPAAIRDLTQLESLSLTGTQLRPLPAEIGSLAQLRSLLLGKSTFIVALPAEISNLGALETLELKDLEGLTALPTTLGNLDALETLILEEAAITSLPSSITGLGALKMLQLRNLEKLSSALPAGLGNLTHLEILSIDTTGLKGSLPASLGNLRALRDLRISNNSLISGTIPSSIGNLSNLVTLDLSANGLTGGIPASISSLTSLKVLSLLGRNAKLSGVVPAGLGNLTQLEALILGGNAFTGALPSLAGLTHLKVVILGPNSFSGPVPAELANLLDLRTIFLRKAGFSGEFPDLTGLAELAELNLSDNAFTPGPIPAWLLGMPKLRRLEIAATGRQGEMTSFAPLAAQLEYLGLRGNAFTPGPVPAWLSSMSKLESLDLQATQRTGPLVNFFPGMAKLSAVNLSSNNFDPGPIPGFFSSATLGQIRRLDLSRTQRKGAIPAGLWTLFLDSLKLEGNQLTGKLSADVRKPYLRILDLSNNQLSGALPPEITTQTGILSLRLNGNKFSGALPLRADNFFLNEDMIQGSLTNAFGDELVGIDLRWNLLTSTDAALIAKLKTLHPAGADFQATQTVAPTLGKATALSKTSIKITWSPVLYQSEGAILLTSATKAAGPFVATASIAPKSLSTFTVNHLKSKTKYFFRLATTTPAGKNNPSTLTSPPGPVFAATTQ